MKHSTLLLVAGLALAASAPAHAQTAAQPAASSALAPAPAGDIARGKKLFNTYGCSDCHGTSGEGGGNAGPKLAPNPLPYSLFSHQLRRPRQRMPIYTDKILSDQQVADLYAYMKAQPKAKDVKDIPLLDKE